MYVCSATLNQVLYFVGLKSTTPTVACALSNTLPALTFAMAAAFRMESVRLSAAAGQAKVFGTVVCVGGSMIMPFYKGPLLRLWASPIHWRFAESAASARRRQPRRRRRPRRRPHHPQLRSVGRVVHHTDQDVGAVLGAVHEHDHHVLDGRRAVRRRQRRHGQERRRVEARLRHPPLLRALHRKLRRHETDRSNRFSFFFSDARAVDDDDGFRAWSGRGSRSRSCRGASRCAARCSCPCSAR